MTRPGFRRLYGAPPWHLMAVLASFVLAGYAVSRLLDEPVLLRITVWFVSAAVVWDLLLGPLLALLDRLLRATAGRVRAAEVSPLNYVRVPLLMSGLLLVVWSPSILRRSQAVYAAKTGLQQEPYLGRWVAVTAVLLVGSAAAFAVAVVRSRRRQRSAERVVAGPVL